MPTSFDTGQTQLAKPQRSQRTIFFDLLGQHPKLPAGGVLLVRGNHPKPTRKAGSWNPKIWG